MARRWSTGRGEGQGVRNECLLSQSRNSANWAEFPGTVKGWRGSQIPGPAPQTPEPWLGNLTSSKCPVPAARGAQDSHRPFETPGRVPPSSHPSIFIHPYGGPEEDKSSCLRNSKSSSPCHTPLWSLLSDMLNLMGVLPNSPWRGLASVGIFFLIVEEKTEARGKLR